MMRFLIPLLFLAVLPSPVRAASVMNVKGNKVLLEIGGMEDAQVGDELFMLDEGGKRKGLLKITQVKGHRALADLVRGQAEQGYTLQFRRSAGAGTGGRLSRAVRPEETEISADTNYARLSRYTGSSMGFLVGLLHTSMSVDVRGGSGAQQRTTNVSLKGTSFGVTGYYDHPILKQLHFRGMGGLEQLAGNGSMSFNDCDGSTSCGFSVTYLSAYGMAKFNYLTGATKAWVGGGLGFLVALSKSSTVLDTSQISTNQVYQISTGVDIPLRDATIPLVLDYGMFPASDSVKASVITIRAGYAWPL